MVRLRAWRCSLFGKLRNFPDDLALHALLINCFVLRLLAEALRGRLGIWWSKARSRRLAKKPGSIAWPRCT
jgi:hypothetical protein